MIYSRFLFVTLNVKIKETKQATYILYYTKKPLTWKSLLLNKLYIEKFNLSIKHESLVNIKKRKFFFNQCYLVDHIPLIKADNFFQRSVNFVVVKDGNNLF